jgi:hypothetical protein
LIVLFSKSKQEAVAMVPSLFSVRNMFLKVVLLVVMAAAVAVSSLSLIVV